MPIYPLSLIIPVYFPQAGWEIRLRERLKELQAHLAIEFEVLIIDDGNLAGDIHSAIQRLQWEEKTPRILRLSENLGKGAALRAGMALMSSTCCITTDVDMPFTTESYGRVWMALQEGADVVFTKRPYHYLEKLPWLRRVLSRNFRRVVQRWTGSLDDADVQAGLKGLSQVGAQRYLETTVPGYLADFEFALLLDSSLKINTVPVEMAGHKTQNLQIGVLFRELGYLFRILLLRAGGKIRER